MGCKVIAEIGCNHGGDVAIARKMIAVAAAFCEVDVVKLQKRCPRELLTPEEYDRPHPNARDAYGPTYGAHREALEFDWKTHRGLKEYCESAGVEYSTSVWDVRSASEIIGLEPKSIKVPSACNLNLQLLAVLAGEFSGQIHVSLGMTTRREEDQIVEFFEWAKRTKDLVLYACTSGYPVAFEDLALLEIERLRDTYGSDVRAIGLSGHHLGIAADVVAMSLGAEYIERHFTLDRTSKGTDHAASLEPDGMRRLVRDIRNVSLGLTPKRAEVLEVEQVQRRKLKEGQIRWEPR